LCYFKPKQGKEVSLQDFFAFFYLQQSTGGRLCVILIIRFGGLNLNMNPVEWEQSLTSAAERHIGR
jgi:hypothetical protein